MGDNCNNVLEPAIKNYKLCFMRTSAEMLLVPSDQMHQISA